MRVARFAIAVAICVVVAPAVVGCSTTKPSKTTQSEPTESPDSAPDKQTTRSQQSAQELFVAGNKRLDDGDFEAAIRAYDRSVEINPGRWRAHLNRGIALSADNQFDAAIRSFEQALVRGGRSEPTVYYNLGNAYQNRGMFTRAIDVYRAGLAHCDEPHLDMLLNLAGAYTLAGKRDAARETYAYVRKLSPQDPRAPYGLGIAAYLDGNFQRAIDLLNQTISLDPSLARVYFTRARVHHQLGNNDKAIADYTKYLEMAPAGAYRRRARGYLQQLEQ